MKKQLIIISSTHAREINQMGKKPVQYNYEPGFVEPLGETSAYIGWKVIEDSLKEYRITHIQFGHDSDEFLKIPYTEGTVTIGKIVDCECNDSELTCLIDVN